MAQPQSSRSADELAAKRAAKPDKTQVELDGDQRVREAWSAMLGLERPEGLTGANWMAVWALLHHLAGYVRYQVIYPGQQRLADELQVPVRTLRALLDHAERAKLISREYLPVDRGGGRKFSVYTLNLGIEFSVPGIKPNLAIAQKLAESRVQVPGYNMLYPAGTTCCTRRVQDVVPGGYNITSPNTLLPPSEEEEQKTVPSGDNDNHGREPAGGGRGGGSSLLAETDHDPDEQGKNCSCGYRHNRFVEPCTVCEEDVPRLAGAWTPADGPRHLRCQDDPDWKQRERQEVFVRHQEAAAAAQRDQEDQAAAFLASAMAEPTRENLENLQMPDLKEVALGFGLELPPRTRAAEYINQILTAVGRDAEVEDDAHEGVR